MRIPSTLVAIYETKKRKGNGGRYMSATGQAIAQLSGTFMNKSFQKLMGDRTKPITHVIIFFIPSPFSMNILRFMASSWRLLASMVNTKNQPRGWRCIPNFYLNLMHNTNQSRRNGPSSSCSSSWIGGMFFSYGIFMVGDSE